MVLESEFEFELRHLSSLLILREISSKDSVLIDAIEISQATFKDSEFEIPTQWVLSTQSTSKL